jgi:hypothetical protein
MLKWTFILTVFLLGLYVSVNYSPLHFVEGFGTRCPNVLVQDGDELILKNTKLAEIPGVNPVRFKNLEEYTEFLQWQQSQKINCPVLYFQKTYNAQNHGVYMQRPPPVSVGEAHPDTDNPPSSMMTYPAMDTHNQTIGSKTYLDQYFDVNEDQEVVSANAMADNWGGAAYSVAAVQQGDYKGNEVYRTFGDSGP